MLNEANNVAAASPVDPWDVTDMDVLSRLNDEGYWTHKPGYKPSTQYDADNKLILDPEKANRKYGELYYSDFCGYVCAPRDYKKKRMKMTRNNQKFVPYNAYKKKTRKRNL